MTTYQIPLRSLSLTKVSIIVRIVSVPVKSRLYAHELLSLYSEHVWIQQAQCRQDQLVTESKIVRQDRALRLLDLEKLVRDAGLVLKSDNNNK